MMLPKCLCQDTQYNLQKLKQLCFILLIPLGGVVKAGKGSKSVDEDLKAMEMAEIILRAGGL